MVAGGREGDQAPDGERTKGIVDGEGSFGGIFSAIKGESIRSTLALRIDVHTAHLLNEDIDEATLRERDPRKVIPPLHGALLKNEQDVMLFERLAFMARREGR